MGISNCTVHSYADSRISCHWDDFSITPDGDEIMKVPVPNAEKKKRIMNTYSAIIF